MLSMELFGMSIPLPDFPLTKDIHGIGMSDWEGYSVGLSKKFDYKNTYYEKDPKLDITAPNEDDKGKYDFVICSDVMEHVPTPVERAFQGCYDLLKPGGVLIFTVPYDFGTHKEYFPELYDYKIKNNVLINITRSGHTQEFSNLIFHGGSGATLEMRRFSEASLIHYFHFAGFDNILIYRSCDKYGIYWPESWSLPWTARK